jgi:hypothetical protein
MEIAFKLSGKMCSVAGKARCAVRAAFSGATLAPFAPGLSEAVPPATTRAGTSQRDVPTALSTYSHRMEERPVSLILIANWN